MTSLTQPSWVSALQRLVDDAASSADVEILQHAVVSGKLQLSVGKPGDESVGRTAGAQIRAGDEVVWVPRAALERLLRSPYRPTPPPSPEDLPQVGGLPPGSRLPFQKEPGFTGRQADLLRLAGFLFHDPGTEAGRHAGTGVVLTGKDGIGKTSLAVEFCYRYGRYFHAVHWLHASQDLAGEIAACGLRMELPGWSEKLPEQVQATLSAWESGGMRLVVLDEVDDPQAVVEWLPRLGNVRLLATSNSNLWLEDAELRSLPLGPLPQPESLELLRRLARRLQGVPDAELEPVLDRLDSLPLGLALAGRCLDEREHYTPGDFLAELETGDPVNLNWRRLKTGDPVDTLAQCLFRLSGYCAAGIPVPGGLLAAMAGIPDDDPSRQVDQALQRLYRLGLLTKGEGGASLHPALSAFARQQDAAAPGSVLPQMAGTLSDLCASVNESGLPGQFSPIRPHLQAALPFVESANQEQAGWLWNNLGYHLGEIDDFDGARNAFEHALSIYESAYGPQHPSVAILLNNLASVLRSRNDLSGVCGAFERALAIAEDAFGPHHPNVAILLNNLGGILHELGDLAGARSAYERALAIDEAAFGPHHANIAILLNNLGRVMKDLGDLSGARSAIERAIKIDEVAFGVDHVKVGQDATNLGLLLKSLGDLTGARDAFEHTLTISEAVYGPNHLNIARDLTNLGYVLHALGELDAARGVFERALAILERYLPHDESYTGKVRGYLESLE